MSVMMKGFIMKNVIKDGNVRHKEGFMGEYDGHEANIVEVRNGKTRHTKLDINDIMEMIGVRSNENDLEDRLKGMLSSGSHTRHTKRRRHRISHKRKRRRKHRRSHRQHTKRRRKHKRKHTKRRKRKR
jgi:hypothetical protein